MTQPAAAVIPIREPETSKLRLRSILSKDQRAALSLALLSRVLGAVQESRVNRAVLVASSIESVLDVARLYSKTSVVAESRHHGGVNQAMKDGLKFLHSGDTENILLLPSDLPLLRGSTLTKAKELLSDYDAVINPSHDLNGTALLAFHRDKTVPLHYDDDSFRKHILELDRLGVKFKILELRDFSYDVDCKRDLTFLMRFFNVAEFADLLEKIPKGL